MASETSSTITPTTKPTFIGIYAIAGTGKSTLMRHLLDRLQESEFGLWESANNLDRLVPGGIEKYASMGEVDQMYWRQRMIKVSRDACAQEGFIGVLTAHAFAWNGKTVQMYHDSDFRVFTHIIYLNIPVAKIFEQRRKDPKIRDPATLDELALWQREEMELLEKKCAENNVCFTKIDEDVNERVYKLLCDIKQSQVKRV